MSFTMTQETQEKWQIALSEWDEWNKSVEDTKSLIKEKYGDLDQLISRAKTIWPDDKEGLSGVSLNPMRNKEAEILWNLYDEIEDIGIRFLAENMGLQPTAYHHYIFLDFWIESVVPEFKYNRDDDPYLQEYLAEYEAKKKQTYFWHFSKPIEWQGKQEIVDSVHWCRGKLNIGEVIEKLQKTKWPSSRQIRTKRLGGRPVELDRIGVEAIVCYILKHKQKLSHKEIAVILGYRLQRDGSGNLMSRTVSDRIKRGEMQLHKRDPSNRITDK